jgi:Mrp family chromosome partitioning ATPase
MFPSVLISADNDRHGYLKSFVLETGYVMLVREETHYPTGSDLSRMLSTTSAELIFLDTRDGEAAATLLDQMRQRWPEAAVIGIGVPSAGRPLSLDAVVSYPPGVEDLQMAIDESLHRVKGRVEENLIAFLPAKAGSGSTTLVLNTASDLAREHGKKVLVIEADLRSGVLSVMLNAEPQHSVQEALRVSGEMNEGQLAHLVTRVHEVDYLLTSRNPRLALPLWSQYFQLLNFVRSRYDLVVVDLPELVNPATREIVRRARQVFTVTTSEVLSLKLAELRAQELLGWGVEESRIQILLNRW